MRSTPRQMQPEQFAAYHRQLRWVDDFGPRLLQALPDRGRIGLLENRRDWRAAVSHWPMLNHLTRLITQSKAIFAEWHEPGVVNADDAEFLRRVAPETWRVSQRQSDEPFWQSVAEQREAWVLKQNFGRMGDNVVMDRLVSPTEWAAALAEARRRPADWVVQACFDVAPLEFAAGKQYPAVGAYLINGRFVGYYSRVAPEPFLTHQAIYVPTVIEAD